MMKREITEYKKKTLWITAIGIGFIVGVLSLLYLGAIIDEVKDYVFRNHFGKSATCKQCNYYFPDGVILHELAYIKEGIKPQKKNSGLIRLYSKKVLVKVDDNNYYRVAPLTHSMPFVLPKVVTFLDKLGMAYEEKCMKEDIPYYPFVITSLTRTKESVKALQRVNGNAVSQSAHLKGKTLDISYRTFNGYSRQLTLFVETVREFRKNNLCYVKFEKRQECLHITVR